MYFLFAHTAEENKHVKISISFKEHYGDGYAVWSNEQDPINKWWAALWVAELGLGHLAILLNLPEGLERNTDTLQKPWRGEVPGWAGALCEEVGHLEIFRARGLEELGRERPLPQGTMWSWVHWGKELDRRKDLEKVRKVGSWMWFDQLY